MTDFIFMIDLTQFTESDAFLSKLEISNFLLDCGFNENLESLTNDLYCAKNGTFIEGKPFTPGKPWSKIWFFKDTLTILGGENENGKNFTCEFLQFLIELESIKPKNESKRRIATKTKKCQTLDDVLDKIGKFGMNSLNQSELEILKKS